MPVQVSCPHCATPCVIAEEHLGRPLRCPRCQGQFSVPPPALRFDLGAATAAGRVRSRNEDAHLILHLRGAGRDGRCERAALVVADGMGGHAAGDVASALTARAVAQRLAEDLVAEGPGAAAPLLQARVTAAIDHANRVVHERATADPVCRDMGATVAVALLWDAAAFLAHAGDCRVHLGRAGRLTQITQDHTLVARMVELGQLSPREANSHPAANEVLQAVGRRPAIEPSSRHQPLEPGDTLLLSCDGLLTDVTAEEVAEELRREGRTAQQLAEALVARAGANGGSDNCTVLAVRCSSAGGGGNP